MLRGALALVRARAVAHGVAVDLLVADGLPPIHGDSVQLEQVVLNLMHNAIEALAGAQQSDGRITVGAVRCDGPARIEISIADNGPGVDAALAERLFAPLTTSKAEGLGLGLSISAAIVESHGGRVWLQSRDKGATEFRFSLPLDAAPAE
jgi:two-component system sensor kinase FixL